MGFCRIRTGRRSVLVSAAKRSQTARGPQSRGVNAPDNVGLRWITVLRCALTDNFAAWALKGCSCGTVGSVLFDGFTSNTEETFKGNVPK